jgi:hypothetical protein
LLQPVRGTRRQYAVMTGPRWNRVKEVFQAVLERPPHERAARVRELCGDDRALETEVESLLATHEDAGSFAEQPAIELLHTLESDSRIRAFADGGLQAGDRLGVYQIQSLVGAGGMGEVYKARDTRLDRTVAIKVLPTHVAADRDRYARFEREARAVARLGPSPYRNAIRRRARRRSAFPRSISTASRWRRGSPGGTADRRGPALRHRHRRGARPRRLPPCLHEL